MKAVIEVQYNGKNVITSDVEKLVKEALKANGTKINTIDTLNIYYAPDREAVYYVATTKDGGVIESTEPLRI